MSPSDEPRTPTHYSNAPSIPPHSSLGTAGTQPFPVVVLPEDRYVDSTMMDGPNEGVVDALDQLQIQIRERETIPSPILTEAPYDQKAGTLLFERRLEEQKEKMRRKWEETRSEASKSCSRGQAEDHKKSTRQSLSLVPYRPLHPPSQGGKASQKSGVSKSNSQRPSRQPTTARTTRSTGGGGTGARHHAGGGPSVGWSEVVVKHGGVTGDFGSTSAKKTGLIVNQTQLLTQRLGLEKEGEEPSVHEIDESMQEMSIDRK